MEKSERKINMENSKTHKSETLQTRKASLFKGRQGDPQWERTALWILLVLTAVAYIWDLGKSGWANSFYSAAVQAGTKSWKAFFFGSIDASNFITVDKPPASLWIMELSTRIFGLNSWSMLVPEALMGVASVWILYMTIRRWLVPPNKVTAHDLNNRPRLNGGEWFRYDAPDSDENIFDIIANEVLDFIPEAEKYWDKIKIKGLK